MLPRHVACCLPYTHMSCGHAVRKNISDSCTAKHRVYVGVVVHAMAVTTCTCTIPF